MAKLKFQGSATGTGTVTLVAPTTDSTRTITLPDGDINLGVGIDDNATSTAITIDSSENVGIGTTSPAGKLDVLTGTFGGLKVEDGTASAGGVAGANITAYQGSTNSNVRSLTVEAQNFIVRTGVPQGTTTTERMRIDPAGIVTMPYQPAFQAFSDSNSNQIASGYYIWTNELLDNGNNFSSSAFTAPTSGIYTFTANAQLYGMSTAGFQMEIRKNGVKIAAAAYGSSDATTDHDDVAATVVVYLNTNDSVKVYRGQSSRGMQSRFSGHLIG